MTAPIKIPKGRTKIIQVALGYDVSNDTLVSEIRSEKDRESDLIATWDISFATDGEDGELIFTLDDAVTSEIEETTGYMDIKRITGGEPVPVFDDILEVLFTETITA